MNALFLERLRAHRRRRVALDVLRQAWLGVHPEQVQHPERDALMLEALAQLAEEGHITLPAAGSFQKFGNPRMPMFVTTSETVVAAVKNWSETSWLPALGFWPLLANSERQAAAAINDWMLRRRGTAVMDVPLRERALEIFGDEKFLDLRVRNGALFSGRLPLSAIGAFQVAPPLPNRPADAPGRPVVIVENHHTYWSLAEWNVKAKRYASVIYGAGHAVASTSRALDEVLREVQGTSVLYFGDLDPEGVRIPLRLRASGISSIEPDLELYDLALNFGLRKTGVGPSPDAIDCLSRWIPTMAEAVKSVWDDGFRIPQESVGTELLHAQTLRLEGG